MLQRRTRRALLITHIAVSVAWIGLDLGLAALLLVGRFSDNAHLVSACYLAVTVLVPVPVTAVALLMVITGVMLGLGTKWGLLQYWWVAVKLTIGLVLNVLVLVALLPEVGSLPDTVGASTAGAARDAVGSAGVQLLFPPVVSTVLLLVAVTLSVAKPWGRTPRGRSAAAG